MALLETALRTQISTIFEPLRLKSSKVSLPSATFLSLALEKSIPKQNNRTGYVNLDPATAGMFGTAAVDMWMRSVHSFLISSALTKASPIWAAVTGYYSSHYTIRGLAHLLGCFQLHTQKRVAKLSLTKSGFVCRFDQKNGSDREHKFYWREVKQNAYFSEDPLFTLNNLVENDVGDASHRERANYADHLFEYPNFQTLDANTLKTRIQFISQIQFDTPPIPKLSKFPDVDDVQVIAYHRLVKFRQLLDEALGGGNRFWNVSRNPGWTLGILDFQLTEQGGLSNLKK